MATPASAWSSPVTPPPAEPSAADVWGRLAEGNQVNWARGGMGAAAAPLELAPAPAKDPFGLSAPASGAASAEWGAPAAPRPAPAPPLPPPPPASAGGEWAAFLAGAGLGPADVHAQPQAALTNAGDLLRRLIAGMVVMLEARARAKAQLGAQGTSLEFEGNNPLKFARAPDKAMAQMLSPPERGFMTGERAIEDAFKDLQAHQMATLGAMQGALAATLARFSPQAIRDRAESRGLLAKIIPAAREAELWNAYEREFEGVARGSDEAFMDVFAKEFRLAYEKAAAEMKR
ncbi:MAG TPA: type VI secretion system-associated FHA domain protein TagH [Caulobacteraceae bacterium]